MLVPIRGLASCMVGFLNYGIVEATSPSRKTKIVFRPFSRIFTCVVFQCVLKRHLMATATKGLRRSDFLRNGFRIFTMHRFDPESAQFVENLEQEIARDSSFALPADSVAELDSATAANRYLQKALASEAIPDLTPGQA